jgi:hypothetical protein
MHAHWLPSGRAKFEWIEDGAFLLQRAEAELPDDASPGLAENFPFPITTVIGLDDFSQTFSYLYADGRGVSRVAQMTLEGREWTIWDRADEDFFQRFAGTFSEDGRKISGRWERSPDGNEWELDFEISYSKVS